MSEILLFSNGNALLAARKAVFRQIYDLTHSQTLSIAFKFCTGIFWLSENQFQQGFTTFSSVFIHCFTVSHPVTSFPFVSVFRSGPGSVKLLHLENVFSLNHETFGFERASP